MKFKKLITILTVSTMVLSSSVWSYAYEIPKELEVKQEYSDMEARMEQERLRIEQEILEEIKNNPVTLSEGEVNPMGLPDIDPVTNPASDNWLTREVASQVGKNNISDLNQEDFNKITKIEFSYNKLTEIPTEIGNLTNLQYLDLRINQLTEIPNEIGNLTNLKSLHLNINQLTELPAEIGNLTNLQYLNLSNNELTKLPKEIGNLTNLQKLLLNYNQLTELPPQICNLTNLQKLWIEDNKLTQLPAEIDNLTNLQSLSLDNNQLTELPAEIGNLTNLIDLALYGNKLTKIPVEIGNLYNLQGINLNYNQLTELPPQIGNLTNLTDLVLYGNKLTKIPAEIGNLSKLQSLALDNNKLIELPAELSNLNKLSELRLDKQNSRLNNKYIQPSKEFTIQNPISVLGNPVVPTTISNNGVYNPADNTITWLASDENRDETFSFSQHVTIGSLTKDFSGTVTLPTVIGEAEPLSLALSNGAASQTISTSETLSIPVSLNGTGDYYALDTQIEYDSNLLEFKGYSVKKGLKAYYSSNENNTLRYILASQGKDNPINSSVSDVVYLNFTPKQAGITNVKIKAGQVANLDKEIDITNLGNISVTIEDKPIVVSKDVNRDGKFSLIDLAIDGYYYGMSADETDNTKYDADIIPDGKIDDADLKEIVKLILNSK